MSLTTTDPASLYRLQIEKDVNDTVINVFKQILTDNNFMDMMKDNYAVSRVDTTSVPGITLYYAFSDDGKTGVNGIVRGEFRAYLTESGIELGGDSTNLRLDKYRMLNVINGPLLHVTAKALTDIEAIIADIDLTDSDTVKLAKPVTP